MTDLASLSGLFVGQLSDAELVEFNQAVDEGRACRSYEGAGGLLGLAKVRIIPMGVEDDGRLFRLHQHDYL